MYMKEKRLKLTFQLSRSCNIAEPTAEISKITAPVEHISFASSSVCPRLAVSALINTSISTVAAKKAAVTVKQPFKRAYVALCIKISLYVTV